MLKCSLLYKYKYQENSVSSYVNTNSVNAMGGKFKKMIVKDNFRKYGCVMLRKSLPIKW